MRYLGYLLIGLCLQNISAIAQMQVTQTKPVHQMICYEPWFSLIKNGIKPVEGRKNSPKYQNIQVGDLIEFDSGNEKFKAFVTEIKKYSSLEEYLQDVTIEKAVPGTQSLYDAIKIYFQWSTPEEIKQYGFLGIFVKPIDINKVIF